MADYPLVYRCAIVVKPLQPFLDWLIKIESNNNPSLAELQHDTNLYLLPDFEQITDLEKAVDKYIKKNYAGIFEHELSLWYLDPDLYPSMTYTNFLQWFEITPHTMIFDMVQGPIDKDLIT